MRLDGESINRVDDRLGDGLSVARGVDDEVTRWVATGEVEETLSHSFMEFQRFRFHAIGRPRTTKPDLGTHIEHHSEVGKQPLRGPQTDFFNDVDPEVTRDALIGD